MKKQNIGIIGLGVMGENLALNIESHGFSVAGYDIDDKRIENFINKTSGKMILTSKTLEDFVKSLENPKRILIMVPAGKAVDSVIEKLKQYLRSGDILIDGGNTYFADTDRRMNSLESTGILYIGTGVSGGEEGALKGPSIMPGGNPEAWKYVKPILQSIAAKTEDGTPCCEWIGYGGAGHFVKMIHNGIEYGDMQIICEAYFLMEKLLGLTTDEMHYIFSDWNKGELNSYLIEITAEIMTKKDPDSGKPLIHLIMDTAEQKGTGKWASQVAFDLGSPAQTIAEAVFARMLSALKNERVEAATILEGPRIKFEGDKDEFLEMIRKSLYCAKICSYAQGFHLLHAANEEYKWDLNFGNISLLWRAGCIIRAQFLGRIKEAYEKKSNLENLLLDQYFENVLTNYQSAWRKVNSTAIENGIPVPAFMSALSYFDSYRTAVLPANLLQAQRDYFGAHTYRRIDKEGIFHTDWKE